ncbi:MAG TPA: universal stress protein [Solirubrobacteraceae bacterium]|jgi:nucleotide-binding universal stress UspA family protein|nr:universal stress protein [Solirubrobacteraceae bacterium]
MAAADLFRSIVVGTDGSTTAAEALRRAVELARHSPATLHVVCAYEPMPGVRLRVERPALPQQAEWIWGPRDDAETTLAQAVERARAAGVERVEAFARQGDPADAILDVAEEQDADLIVVGNRGLTGAKRFLLGGVPNKISHHAPCSVLIIRTS